MTSSSEDFHFGNLKDLFEKIKSPDATAVFPGLEVDGLGFLSLPLGPEQAKQLQQLCGPAPFGRGQKTLYDPKVRKTSQLAPEKLTFHNPGWPKYIERLTDRVKGDLGVPDATSVKADLYKMLLYQQGDHFVPHRDTEKAPGMFATMTVLLPSQHEGGQLVVKHKREQKEFAFGEANGYSVCCTAFYADCKHELKPVDSGFRLALVYNLCNTSTGPSPAVQSCSAVVTKLRKVMQQWALDESPEQGIWMLEHKYSKDGLQGITTLKNHDQAVASILQSLAAEHCLQVHLAFLELNESGRAEGSDYLGWDLDETDYYELSATGWMDLNGSLVNPSGVEAKDIIQGERYFEDEMPEDEQVEEATGNEGATMSRWYQQAALIIQPLVKAPDPAEGEPKSKRGRSSSTAAGSSTHNASGQTKRSKANKSRAK